MRLVDGAWATAAAAAPHSHDPPPFNGFHTLHYSSKRRANSDNSINRGLAPIDWRGRFTHRIWKGRQVCYKTEHRIPLGVKRCRSSSRFSSRISGTVSGTAIRGTAISGTAIRGTSIRSTTIRGTAIHGNAIRGTGIRSSSLGHNSRWLVVMTAEVPPLETLSESNLPDTEPCSNNNTNYGPLGSFCSPYCKYSYRLVGGSIRKIVFHLITRTRHKWNRTLLKTWN